MQITYLVTQASIQIYTLVAQGGNFQVGDNITGNFTNATGTVVDVQNVTIGGSNFNRLTYTVGTGAFTTQDIVIQQVVE